MRITPTLKPTANQLRVLAKLAASATPAAALREITQTPNMVAARDALARLGLLTFDRHSAQLTDRGKAVSTLEGILDQTGVLTDVGKQFAYAPADVDPRRAAPVAESMCLLRSLLSGTNLNA